MEAVKTAIRQQMRVRGWPDDIVLLTSKEESLILSDATLMTAHGAEMDYITRKTEQRWSRVQVIGGLQELNHLLDAGATIFDMTADICQHLTA